MLRALTLVAAVLAFGVSSAQASSAPQPWTGPRWGEHVAQAHATLAATTDTTTFTVPSSGNLGAARLARIEQAVTLQVNTQVLAHWDRSPIQFGPGGIPVNIAPAAQVAVGCGQPGDGGCHSVDANGQPVIWIANETYMAESVAISHEIIETVVDPGPSTLTPTGVMINGMLAEPCDPVQNNTYQMPNGILGLKLRVPPLV
jgi:hypothetical protein